jgi:aminoglycoside phosphotransferase (APT) family kinase protein
MTSITKNRLSADTIGRMVQKAFGLPNAASVSELTEGYFNAAYLVGLPDGRETVLKVAPPPGSLLMSYEKNIMSAEVQSMRLVKGKTSVPLPDVLFYDNSRSVCGSDYFFMTKLEGKSLNSLSSSLPAKSREGLEFDTGRYNAEINRITGSKFGYFGQPDRQGSDWPAVFADMIDGAFDDAEALKIDVGADRASVQALLAKYRSSFEEVTIPRLIHWDLWAGNIFVKDGRITGLIDFERCLWGDPLMEVGFRSGSQCPAFIQGYGAAPFTDRQNQRIKWYDLYLSLLMALEPDYRKYPDHSMLIQSRKKIGETAAWLNNHSER